MQLPQIHIIDAHAFQGAVQFLFCLSHCTSISLRRHVELRAIPVQPGSDAQFSISVARRYVNVIDPVLEQYLQRAVCLLLCNMTERCRSENSACAQMTATAKELGGNRHAFPLNLFSMHCQVFPYFLL